MNYRHDSWRIPHARWAYATMMRMVADALAPNHAHWTRLGWLFYITLQWRHNERDGVSNHRRHDCLLKRLFRCRSKKTRKLRVTGLCVGNSPVTGEFPAQRASNAEICFHLMTSSWHIYMTTVRCIECAKAPFRIVNIIASLTDEQATQGTMHAQVISSQPYDNDLFRARNIQVWALQNAFVIWEKHSYYLGNEILK